MVEFPVNPTRVDPYKNFNFRIKWDGKYVAGVSKVSALKRTTEVIAFRDGGDASASRKSPGRTEYEAITLERGLTQDHTFEDWANKVWRLGAAARERGRARRFSQGHLPRVLQRGGASGARLQDPSLLAVALPGVAFARRQQRGDRHRAARARERGLGARCFRDRTGRAGLRPCRRDRRPRDAQGLKST